MEPVVLDGIINRLLEVRERPGKQVQLSESEIRQLCLQSKDIFLQQPNLLDLEAPIKICGDIHGQYSDLLRFFEYGGLPPESNYLFLGDYVDHGKQSLETICLLLAYKIKYPENFFLLRGNHECASLNRIYGFYDECKRRFNVRVWKVFTDCFNCLPVAALIDEKILCMHGGLSPDLHDLDQIRNLQRPTDVLETGLLCDLLWSDPSKDVKGWGMNDRGVSYTFGSDKVTEFLQKQDLDLICRAHQVVEDGYEFFADRQLVTIFSAPNYRGEFDNAGAMMSVDETLMCSFQILKPADKKPVYGFGSTTTVKTGAPSTKNKKVVLKLNFPDEKVKQRAMKTVSGIDDCLSHFSDEEDLEEISAQELLGLSYMEMKSLPQAIFGLVSLQKLFLRSCAILMMELPPEIGELTNLEVLDLEGTEILCLPKEISKLVKLTSLKVSFYGYANQTVIPKTVLSNLSRLKELIIDVTPYGEWWDVEVKSIIDDLRNLKELTTLKLYLPTPELLKYVTSIFPGLANFRFTVGCHEEHFISRLPRDVEEEFNNWEKLEKGLKFINGDCIPNEITKVLKHADVFFLQRQWTAESLSEFGHENLNEVKFFLVMECNEFQTIINSEKLYQRKDRSPESEDFQNFDEAMVLGSLERLIVRYMKNMESIWKGPVGKGSLSNLKSLALHTCPNLTTLFTIDMLSNLINLEELIVEDCPKIHSLASLKNSGSELVLYLPSLKKISLLWLPGLVSISSGLEIALKLERMVIYDCPKLEKLSTAEVSSTELKVIKGEKEWWNALKWYDSDVSTELEDYLARHFIPLTRDGDLIAQLTKD